MPASDEERTARAALCRILEPGDGHGGRWLRDLGPVELLRRLTTSPYRPGFLPGASDRRIQGLLRRATRIRPRQDLEAIQAAGGRFIVPGDPEWPATRRPGRRPALGLWIRGHHDLRRWALRSVAVVGARACTPYGAHMAADLGAALAERGWVVVSGAATGVDAAAHRGSLGAAGATIAVLACGVDVAYPRGHTALIDRIARQGLVIGELPPGDHPTPTRFILRNRVIAALTRGTLVVEAAHRSGALATAREAQRLNRHTMGVPGPATSALSAGVHELLAAAPPSSPTPTTSPNWSAPSVTSHPPVADPSCPATSSTPPPSASSKPSRPPARPASPSDVATEAGTSVDDALGRLYELHALGHVAREGDLWRLPPASPRHPNTRRGAP